MVSWCNGDVANGLRSSITPHPSGSSPRSDCASTNRSPPQLQHNHFDATTGVWGSLERWKVEMLKNGIGCDALYAVVTDLTSDISQGSGPRVRWFYGVARGLEMFVEAHSPGGSPS